MVAHSDDGTPTAPWPVLTRIDASLGFLHVQRRAINRVVGLMRPRPPWLSIAIPHDARRPRCVDSPRAIPAQRGPSLRARATTRNSPSIPTLRVGPRAGWLAPRPPSLSPQHHQSSCRPHASTRNSPSIPTLCVGPRAGWLAPRLALRGARLTLAVSAINVTTPGDQACSAKRP